MKTKTFYIASELAGEKEVGSDYPQAYDFIKGIDADAPHSFYDFEEYVRESQSFPDYKPLLDGLKLARRAKPTDFLSTALDYVVSKRGIRILDKLNLTEHRIYPMKIYARNIPLLYFHVPFLEYGYDSIIWEKCEFSRSEIKNNCRRRVYDVPSFSSYDEYISYSRSKPYFLKLSKLAVDKTFDINLDHFKSSVGIYDYVSERFIETYKANNLTGLGFEDSIEVVQY